MVRIVLEPRDRTRLLLDVSVMRKREVIRPDWVWTGDRWSADTSVAVDSGGRIEALGVDLGTVDRRLPGCALLPGFVNAHSHAFQRGLRGRGETFPSGSGSFWTWRQEMYRLVEEITADRLYQLTLDAYREMLACGITAVGEFHYLHHEGSGEDFALDQAVAAAARDAGIRQALLQTYYRTGAIGQPLQGAQRRFSVSTPREYWKSLEAIGRDLSSSLQTVGAVVHSVRAASLDETAEIHAEARRRGLVFHMHVEEQRQEIEACRQAYGRAPLELLLERLQPGGEFTAIHCTHSTPADLRRLLDAGAQVCLCPLTEANLGDGLAEAGVLAGPPNRICLGTDSNSRLDMLEEMRWAEYGQRLKGECRGALRDFEGSVARGLLCSATANGARSLGIECGEIAPGKWADFVLVDLRHPSLGGWSKETLQESIVFGASDRIIAGVCVGGRWVVDPSAAIRDR